MKNLSIMLIGLMLITAISANAATLDRGVSVSSMFIAGGSAPNAMMPSLKYQMAIDSYIGLSNRYTTNYVTTNYQSIYHNDTYKSHDNYDNHNTIITVNADIKKGEISVTTNPYITNKSTDNSTKTTNDASNGGFIINP